MADRSQVAEEIRAEDFEFHTILFLKLFIIDLLGQIYGIFLEVANVLARFFSF
jgi:hypothetical protein